jgi:hypothetical protein
MCGIAGFIASRPLSPAMTQSLCKALLFYSQERGEQSAGIWINNQLLKRAISADELWSSPGFLELFKETGSNLALLHTRNPTTGERGDAQAQPFYVSRPNGKSGVIGIHNGVCSNYQVLAKEHGVELPSGVDSELFPQVVALKGIAVLPYLVRSAYGNHAVAMLYGGRLYLCRDGNPLEVLTIRFQDDSKVSIFASTEDILLRAARFVWLLDKNFRTKSLTVRQLYQLQPSGLREVGEPANYGIVEAVPKAHDPFFVPKGAWSHTKKGKKRHRGHGKTQDYDSHGWPDTDVAADTPPVTPPPPTTVSGVPTTLVLPPPGTPNLTHLERLRATWKSGVSLPFPGLLNGHGTPSTEGESEDLTGI